MSKWSFCSLRRQPPSRIPGQQQRFAADEPAPVGRRPAEQTQRLGVQGSLLEAPDELRQRLQDVEADAELRLPRCFADLDPSMQDAWIPQLIEHNFFRGGMDADEAWAFLFADFLEGVEGEVSAWIMNAPYWPRLRVRGRGDALAQMVDASWDRDLDHVVRFYAEYEHDRLRVHVSAPRRLGLDLYKTRRALAKHLWIRWACGEQRMEATMAAFFDRRFWQNYLRDYVAFDGRGACLG